MTQVSAVEHRHPPRRLPAAIGTAAFVLAVDQTTKWLVTDRLGPDAASHRFRLLDDVAALRYVENSGVAFGLLQGQVILVTLLAIVVVVFLVRMYRQAGATSWPMTIAGGLIAGGAAGNLVDRVRLGYVVDFVAVSVWPTFNLADSAITAGALLLAWHYLRDGERVAMSARDRGATIQPPLAALNRDGER